MKKEEKICLKDNKLKEGKTYKQALKEIKRLEQSQIIFKENEREIKRLNKKIKQLEKENSELKNKLFKLNLELNTLQEEKRNKLKEKDNGELKYLKRIIMILSDEKKPMTISELAKACLTVTKKIYPCVGFLEKNNLINYKKDADGIGRYWI